MASVHSWTGAGLFSGRAAEAARDAISCAPSEFEAEAKTRAALRSALLAWVLRDDD